MIIIEETDSEFKSELQVWENTGGKIWMQIGDEPMEPHGVHGMTLTKDDAVALIKELTRMVGYVPTSEIKLPAQGIKEKHEGQQLKLEQRVNWSK